MSFLTRVISIGNELIEFTGFKIHTCNVTSRVGYFKCHMPAATGCNYTYDPPAGGILEKCRCMRHPCAKQEESD